MNSKVIVALDYETEAQALSLVDQIDPSLCRLKVGKEMFTTLGTNFVKQLHERQFDVFLDLKFHDIPNTVARAVRSAADLGVWMVDVHASGGLKMMEEAKDMIHNSVEAFVEGDEANAQKVVEHDDVVDDLFNDMKKEMMQAIREQNLDADRVVDYLMMAKYLEKVGDHAVNIAQWAIFRMTGDMEGVKLY